MTFFLHINHYLRTGTLDDFSFDSDDEAVKKAKATSQKVDQNDGVEDETNGNTKAKADKPFVRFWILSVVCSTCYCIYVYLIKLMILGTKEGFNWRRKGTTTKETKEETGFKERQGQKVRDGFLYPIES